MTRVGLHDYVTDPLLSQKDGANLAHENIAQLLRGCSRPDIEVRFHDFMRLFEDDSYARQTLGNLDCVVSNVGPHAHYYFWLRERMGLSYRIIRDVRTAIWSSYLLQEYLCQPLLRDGDTLLVASRYTQDVYQHIFPHLSRFPSAICYPLTVCFPEPRPEARAGMVRQGDAVTTLGYLGRLSEDKNFPDVVDLLISLNSISESRYRLIACGEVHSPTCAPELVRARLRDALGSDDGFTYYHPRANDEIWSFLADVDVLLFPSTSNLETLGRVLVEASYARIPVVSGDHAAAAELVHPAGLCRVQYRANKTFTAHLDHKLGRVAITEMAASITAGGLRPSDCYERYRQHPTDFINLLLNAPTATQDVIGDRRAPLLEGLVVDFPPALELKKAMDRIGECASWFTALQCELMGKPGPLSRDLLTLSRFPDRTQRYLDKSFNTAGDFTNIGGIDIELCHIMKFYPTFQIATGMRDAVDQKHGLDIAVV